MKKCLFQATQGGVFQIFDKIIPFYAKIIPLSKAKQLISPTKKANKKEMRCAKIERPCTFRPPQTDDHL